MKSAAKTKKINAILVLLSLLSLVNILTCFANHRLIKSLNNNSEVQYQPTKIDTVIYDKTDNKYYYQGKQITHFNPSKSRTKEEVSVIKEIKNTFDQMWKYKDSRIVVIGSIISIISLIAVAILIIFVLTDL